MVERYLIWKKDVEIAKLITLDALGNDEISTERNLALVLSLNKFYTDRLDTNLGGKSANLPPLDTKSIAELIIGMLQAMKDEGIVIKKVIIDGISYPPYAAHVADDLTVSYETDIIGVEGIDSALPNVFSEIGDTVIDVIKDDVPPQKVKEFKENPILLLAFFSFTLPKKIGKIISETSVIQEALRKRAVLYEKIHKPLKRIRKYAKLYLYIPWTSGLIPIITETPSELTLWYYGISDNTMKVYDGLILEKPLDTNISHIASLLKAKNQLSALFSEWISDRITGILTTDPLVVKTLKNLKGGEKDDKTQ